MTTAFSYTLIGIAVIIGCNLVISYLILNAVWDYSCHQNTKQFSAKSPTFPKILYADVDCSKLIAGDIEEEQRALGVLSRPGYSRYLRDVYSKAGRNCSEFLLHRSYITEHLTEEERHFPIAFSLLVYKDIVQVERLLRAIYRPQNYYCLHVDRRSAPVLRQQLRSLVSCFTNVFLPSGAVDVRWGKFSVVQAELVCMKELLKYKWKYFINLTGQEFPLKTNRELVKILQSLHGANDIQGSLKRRSMYRTLTREPAPHGIVLTKGSVHIAAVRGFVEFVIGDPRARDFLDWLDGTYIPDETFFSSLNYSPSLAIPGSYNGSLDQIEETPSRVRYKLWYPSLCHGRWQRAICVFNVGDLHYMTRSRQMFANKFDQDYGQVAYDCLEEWHRNRTLDEHFGGHYRSNPET